MITYIIGYFLIGLVLTFFATWWIEKYGHAYGPPYGEWTGEAEIEERAKTAALVLFYWPIILFILVLVVFGIGLGYLSLFFSKVIRKCLI